MFSKIRALIVCLVSLSFFTTISHAEQIVHPAIQTCLDRGLVNVLQGELSLIDTQFVAMQVAGPQWKSLTPTEQATLHTTIKSVMERRIKKNAGSYMGATVIIKNIKTSNKVPNYYTISGFIATKDQGSYSYSTQVIVSSTQCRFYTLVIEGLFRLSTWLRDQPEVTALLSKKGSK